MLFVQNITRFTKKNLKSFFFCIFTSIPFRNLLPVSFKMSAVSMATSHMDELLWLSFQIRGNFLSLFRCFLFLVVVVFLWEG